MTRTSVLIPLAATLLACAKPYSDSTLTCAQFGEELESICEGRTIRSDDELEQECECREASTDDDQEDMDCWKACIEQAADCDIALDCDDECGADNGTYYREGEVCVQ